MEKKKRDITDLRESLFDTIEMLKEGKLEPQAAKEVSQLAGRIIDTAKVEIQGMGVLRMKSSGFIEAGGMSGSNTKQLNESNENS